MNDFIQHLNLVPWLSLIPLLGAALILIMPAGLIKQIRFIGVAASFLVMILAAVLCFSYDPSKGGWQFVTRIPWVPSFGLAYQVGLDGMGAVMILLHGILSFCAACVSLAIHKRIKLFFILFLILVASIFGVFTTLDLFFLYFFYEMALIPLYPMIGIWGSHNREYGGMKLTLYISLGAMVALVGLIAIYLGSGLKTFDLIQLTQHATSNPFSSIFQYWCAPLLIFGFGVIASLWPFHSWSPIGYAVAPTPVSMLHAGVLKKMGIFITIRLVLSMLPIGAKIWMPLVSVLCVVNILYGAWAAMAQKDMKYVIGFASVSHMGYAFLGLASLTSIGLTGAIFFMFAHGIMAALCFALIGFIYQQTHTRLIPDLGGLAKQMPFISICFVIAAFASSGLPGLANFISEILIFFGAWETHPVQTICAIFGIVVTATYMLRLIRNVFFGSMQTKWLHLKDAKGFGKLPYAFLIAILFIFGTMPMPLIKIIQPTTNTIIAANAAIFGQPNHLIPEFPGHVNLKSGEIK